MHVWLRGWSVGVGILAAVFACAPCCTAVAARKFVCFCKSARALLGAAMLPYWLPEVQFASRAACSARRGTSLYNCNRCFDVAVVDKSSRMHVQGLLALAGLH
jgi:hypothetical protein